MTDVLFITQGDETLASSRYRVYDLLRFFPSDLRYRTVSLPSGGQLSKAFFLLKILIMAARRDAIFLQKILLPKFIVSLLQFGGRKLIYDYDDALFAKPPSGIYGDNVALRKEKLLQATISRADHVICGNRFLADYARNFNADISVIPTAVNSNQYKPMQKKESHRAIIIGWIGKSENLEYLQTLAPVLSRLGQRFADKVCLHVICDRPLEIVSDIEVVNIPWELGREAFRISSFDIGIMPLSDNDWARGKCAFKLIQYMASGVAPVCSPVGMNSEVVKHGFNGYLAGTPEEWYDCLEDLVIDKRLRERFATAARETAVGRYDSRPAAQRLFSTIRAVASND